MDSRTTGVMRRTAVNKSAAVVTSQSGCDDTVDYVKNLKAETRYAGPSQLTEFRGPKEHNLTGQRFGELEVVGDVRSRRWMCRCKCGWYVVKRSIYLLKRTTVRSGVEIPVMCSMCFDCWDQ
jgi:hypothetical protein